MVNERKEKEWKGAAELIKTFKSCRCSVEKVLFLRTPILNICERLLLHLDRSVRH